MCAERLSSSDSSEAELIDQGAHHRTVVWGAVIVSAYNGQVSVDLATALERAVAQRAPENGPIGLVIHVIEGAERPEGAVRDAFTRMMSAVDDRVAAWAIVFEGTGFWAAAMRAIQSGILLTARIKAPAKVCPDPAGAATWLHQTMSKPLPGGAGALRKIIEANRFELAG